MSKTLLRMMVDVPKKNSPSTPGTPAAAGCPVPVELIKKLGELRVNGPAGSCPVALKPLEVVPMQNRQWTQLSFLAQGPGEYELVHDDAASASANSADALEQKAWVKQDDNGVQIGNGRLVMTLPKNAPGPISEITLDGKAMLNAAADLQFQVNDATSLNGKVASIEVLEDSPVRVKVRVHGEHKNDKGALCLTYQLDVELWANQTAARLDYQYFHVEPGVPEVALEGMRVVFKPSLQKDAASTQAKKAAAHFVQVHYDLVMTPRLVTNPKRVEIAADWSRKVPYFTDHDMLCDDIDYPYYLITSANQAQPWLGLTGEGGSVYVQLEDMINMRPKRLAAEDGVLTTDLWPREAGPLQLRQGKARRHTMTLAFFDAEHQPQKLGDITGALATPMYEGRATLQKQDTRSADAFEVASTIDHGKSVRMEQYLLELTTGVNLGQGELDYGDGVEFGYSKGYAQIARQPLQPGQTDDIHPMSPAHPDAIDPGSLMRYVPVWANNEYDLIHTMSIELLRTGRRSIWPTLKAIARHNIEVDFIHYSDDEWLHHGSPAHSAHHDNASAYPSHLWTQGLLEYYCLSGDKDALDVAIKLGDTIIANLEHPVRKHHLWGFNREIGWALLSLVQLAEATGIERFNKHAGSVVDYLVGYNREGQDKAINLSGVDAMDDIHSQMVGAFFGYASMLEAMDRYARMTGRADVEQWLDTILRQILDAAKRMIRGARHLDAFRRMLPLGMAIGYERTGDRSFLEIGMLTLEMFLQTEVGITPTGEVKFAAMIHRSFVRFLKHAQDQELLGKLEFKFASAAWD